jgi:DNA polymerase-3 subunit epsilon
LGVIQRHRPRYTRGGRDPERYCYLKLTKERFPRLSLVRRVLGDGARYLGPFVSAGQAELVKTAIEDALPLRRCTPRIGPRTRTSPCALLDLGRCMGPCTGQVAPETYGAVVARLEAALEGDPEALLAPLRDRMAGYAAQQRYEQAAATRDRLDALTRAMQDLRRFGSLAAVDEVVLARRHARGREVTILRHGQLAAVGVLAPDDPGGLDALRAAATQAERFDGPPPRHLVDEFRLVAHWLDGVAGEAELLDVRGCLASPSAGGAALQVRYTRRRSASTHVPGEARGRPQPRPSVRRGRRLPGRR